MARKLLTKEEIAERLSDQVAQAEAAIAALTHENVPGKAELAQKVAEAKVLVAADSLDITKIKAYTKDLKTDRTALQALDAAYTAIENALTELATAGQDNQFPDGSGTGEAAQHFLPGMPVCGKPAQRREKDHNGQNNKKPA